MEDLTSREHLTFESGQKATVLSGIDSNLNGDAAADRTLLNPNGVEGTGSARYGSHQYAGQVVGYLADNPNAQYIQAGRGVFTTTGRNTLQLPGINNLDLTIYKNFAITETTKMQFRVDFFNAFNHPQYIPGSPNAVIPVSTTSVAHVNTISLVNTSFNKADEVFSSNPRVIQMALRFTF